MGSLFHMLSREQAHELRLLHMMGYDIEYRKSGWEMKRPDTYGDGIAIIPIGIKRQAY